MPIILLGAAFALGAASGAKVPGSEIILPDGFRVRAELAVTPQEQELGLQFRTELGSDEGMLFVNEAESLRTFWMLNTLIPLDMVFIGSDKRVTVVHENVPPVKLNTAVQNPQRRSGMAQYVLELPAGTAKAHGVKKGSLLKFNPAADKKHGKSAASEK